MKKTIGIVETKYGKLRGGASDRPEYEGITYFKGVPYAAPPVVELRWKPPVDPEPWEGVLVADHFAPMGMQPSNGAIYDSLAGIIGTIARKRCQCRREHRPETDIHLDYRLQHRPCLLTFARAIPKETDRRSISASPAG